MGLGAQPARVASLHAEPLVLAQERMLPVEDTLQHLLPVRGLQRGSTIAVTGGGGSVSLAFALMAEAARQGSWIAVLGTESLGLAAIGQCGVPLERVVLIDNPARSEPAVWADVAGALIDGFDLVVLMRGQKGPGVTMSAARRLATRARDRGAVLVSIGRQWITTPDVHLTVTGARWHGAGKGHGHLRSRRVRVLVGGRRQAASAQTHSLWLPDEAGRYRVIADDDRYAGSDVDALVAVADASSERVEDEATDRQHLRVV